MINTKDIVLGIDFGQTIESKNASGEKVENPRAMEVVARCVKHCKRVYVISKVNPKQMFEVAEWMYKNDFFQKTGLPIENVRFCADRHGKGPIANGLGINCFIDDRPEVMSHMPRNVYKMLFQPIPEEVKQFGQEHVLIVNSWNEIEKQIFE